MVFVLWAEMNYGPWHTEEVSLLLTDTNCIWCTQVELIKVRSEAEMEDSGSETKREHLLIMMDGKAPGILLSLPLLTSFSMTDTPNQLKHSC